MNIFIKIDQEFKSLIPPLSSEEYAQLEANLIKDGCRDPLVLWQGTLIDGHNRNEICTRNKISFETIEMEFQDREAVMDWMDANQLGRRNISPDAFRLLLGRRYNRMKKVQGGTGANQHKQKAQFEPFASTADKLAVEHSVSRETVKRAGKFAEEVEASPALQDAIKQNKPVRKVKKEVQKEEKKKALEEAIQSITESDSFEVHHLSMEKIFENGVKADCIISDPPYPKEFVHLYGELAELAAKAGIDRVAVMCGQSYLPQIIKEMSEHLKYRWMIAYLTPGGQAVQQWQAKVNTFWKPILVFGDSDKWIGDVSTSKTNDNDKRFHEWGQSESGMSDLVNRLSKPGETVFDPFMGAGTTGVVSLASGRKFIGCDIDEDHCNAAAVRMDAITKEMGQ